MANHGAASETKYTYAVFLSFRGEDTRHTFTCHLYNALDRKGIITFMDNEEMKLGDQLGPTLLKAIEESRISIVVFSKNYASSSWCLDELVQIHECMKSKNQLVWPIFYKVDPSDVRHQNGSYGDAMTKHESRFGKDSEKVQKWRSALKDIANLKGEHLKEEQGIEKSKFIDDLARQIFIKVSPKDLSSNEHIVGREYLVEELKSLLKLESHNITCQLGIHGTGGIGKTTLAKALYDSIYKQFQCSCFLPDIRETSNQIKGIKRLQKQLLSEILEGRKIKLKSIEEGIKTIKSRLGFKRVLIVLDDVDDIVQLNKLAKERDWFGPGSRIIITTRDKHLLDVGNVEKSYEVNVLNDQESLELFSQSAFGKSYPETNYEDLSNRAMRCCKGLPLALKVLGSHMVGKDLGGWNDALDRYENSPHPKVQEVLRISYDSLSLDEKNIFLDIACFFKGQKLEYVKRVLDACYFSSGDGITTLVNKSLLTVDNHRLGMHDLIQDMGREIVKEEAGNKVGESSRLWHHEDVLQVLADNNGSSAIQGIMLRPPQREEINCTGTVFEKMKNLRILIVDNTSFSHEPSYLPNNLRVLEWMDYPSKSFPSGFYPRKIGSFNLSFSPLLVLEKPFQRFDHLTYINISCCYEVTEFPDVSGAMNLRELRLDSCLGLVSIHKSVGLLANLVFLSASECINLESFVPTIDLPSLEYLSFEYCSRLAHFPEIKGTMDKPLKIKMSKTAIKELPKSIEKLIGLNHLEMEGCKELRHLPSSLFVLPNFVTLNIGDCRELRKSFRRFEGSHSVPPKLETLYFEKADLSDEDVQAIIYSFPNLKYLNVSWNNFMSLPPHIKESTKLTTLDVSYCANLEEIPQLPSSVQIVDASACYSLTPETSDILWSQVRKESKGLEVMMPKREIPKWFDYVLKGGFPVFKMYNFPNLKYLNVSWNNFGFLPAQIKESTKLTTVDVSYCAKLREIPQLPSSVQILDASECNSLTPETSDILLSQVREEYKRLRVMMKEREIPETFDYVFMGGFQVLKARGKFPMIALAFVFGDVKTEDYGSSEIVCMHLFIEGEHRRKHNFFVKKNHVFLCDLRVFFGLEEWEDVGNDWKTIHVYCETDLPVSSWGIYLYKLETNVEDIQITSQDRDFSLLRSLRALNIEEQKVRNKKLSLNLPEMYRDAHMLSSLLEEEGYFKDKPPEHLEIIRRLLRVFEKGSRCAMAKREMIIEWSHESHSRWDESNFIDDLASQNFIKVSPEYLLKSLMEKSFQSFDHLTYMDISGCDSVTEFPDVSGAMNLRELRLDSCWGLVSIHESVGLLLNLVFLSASECTNLKSFVPTIYLPSLEYLSFDDCSSLAHFPEIKGTMEKPLKIKMSKTAIKELPESIEKLTGLYHLEMDDCEELQHLPSSLFVLPNFVTLNIGGCCQLRESFRRFKGSHSACPKLETLYFKNAYLSDEDVRAIIYNFPNLKDLNVSRNNFVSLPAHIKESTKLTTLNVNDCTNLQEIPQLPSSVQIVDASECDSLTPEASNILWSQVRKEIKKLEVKMPRIRDIPEWFDYVKEGGFPVFKARGKFPTVALAFVFGEVTTWDFGSFKQVRMHLFIEDEHTGDLNHSMDNNHVLLCDLRCLFPLKELEDVGNDWKTIKVCCDKDLTVCSWGVYVYKHETNIEDIQFLSQHPTSSLVRSPHALSEVGEGSPGLAKMTSDDGEKTQEASP